MVALIVSRSARVGAVTPVAPRCFGGRRSQRAAASVPSWSPVHLGDVLPELRERRLHLAGEGGAHRFLQLGVALAEDLVHDHGLHPGRPELRERLAGLHGAELLLVAHQDGPGEAERGRGAEQPPHLLA